MQKHFIILFSFVFLLWSCEELSDNADCPSLETAYTAAKTEFDNAGSNATLEQCQAVAAAYKKALDESCDNSVYNQEEYDALNNLCPTDTSGSSGNDSSALSYTGWWYATSIGFYQNSDCSGNLMLRDSNDCAQNYITWHLNSNGILEEAPKCECENEDDGCEEATEAEDSTSCISSGGEWNSGNLATYSYNFGMLSFEFNGDGGIDTGYGQIIGDQMIMNLVGLSNCDCEDDDCDEHEVESWNSETGDSLSCEALGAEYQSAPCMHITFDRDSVLTSTNCEGDEEEDNSVVDAYGFVIENEAGSEVYREFEGATSGSLNVALGDTTHLSVHFLDSQGQEIELQLEHEESSLMVFGYDMQIAIIDEVQDEEHDYMGLEIIGVSAGSTSFQFWLYHSGSIVYTSSNNIYIIVN